jgi:hypothetical protein
MSRTHIRLAVAVMVEAMLIASLASSATFRQPVRLSEMAGTSDLIVVGTITNVAEDRFTVGVSQKLHGEDARSLVDVEIPRRSPDEARWTPYANGQTILAFLVDRPGPTRPAQRRLHLAGFGGDGEFPVDNRFVYFVGHYIDGLPVETHYLGGAKFPAQRYDRSLSLDAIASLSACFKWARSNTGATDVTRSCDDARLNAYRERSPIHRFLADETIARLKPQ